MKRRGTMILAAMLMVFSVGMIGRAPIVTNPDCPNIVWCDK